MRRSVMNGSVPGTPAPSNPARTRNAANAARPLVVLALALSVVLAGCTGGGDPADPTEPGGPTAPTSLVGAECAELASLDDIRSLLGEAVEPVDNLFTPGGTWPLSSVGLRQAGGLQCEWSDAANRAGEYEALLEIDILPNAADEWATWHSAMTGNYPNESDDGTVLWSCNSSLGGRYHYCDYDVFAGGKWAAIGINNIAPDADTAALVGTIVTALERSTSPTAEWTPPPLAGLPTSCEALLPLDTIRSTLGVDDMDEREAPLLMPYALNTGLDDALNCSWSNPYSAATGTPLQVVVLPGASWAWEASWAAPRPDHSPAHAVEGLGDAAFAGCQPIDNPSCFVDVLVGGAWIAIDGKGAANEAKLIELATVVVSSIGG